jgi:hypothetical protein
MSNLEDGGLITTYHLSCSTIQWWSRRRKRWEVQRAVDGRLQVLYKVRSRTTFDNERDSKILLRSVLQDQYRTTLQLPTQHFSLAL